MPLVAKDTGNKDFEPIPTGPQQAVCAFVEDIGTHETTYQGNPLRRHQCVVVWELEEKMTKGDNAGKPFLISKFYTLSLNEKANLRKDLEAWRGRNFTAEELEGFDLEKLVGANCVLNIGEEQREGKTYAVIHSIMPLMRSMSKINVTNRIAPAWIDKMRKLSIEWQESHAAKQRPEGAEDSPHSDMVNDDLPF